MQRFSEKLSTEKKIEIANFLLKQENYDKIFGQSGQIRMFYWDCNERFCWNYDLFVAFLLEIFEQKVVFPAFDKKSEEIYVGICYCLYDIIVYKTNDRNDHSFDFIIQDPLPEGCFNRIFQKVESENCFIQ